MPKTKSVKNKPVGLSSEQAQQLLEQYGLNQITTVKRLSGPVAFILKFKNPLVGVLLFASVISAAFGDWINALIIFAIITISISLDFYNTYKSENAAEALKSQVMIKAKVSRDGQFTSLPLEKIVPGDLVELSTGDLIPADGTIVSSSNFFLNEAPLTGESFPVGKEEGGQVLMGTNVIAGTGLMQVQQTGLNTEFSNIAKSLQSQNLTDFEKGIKDFSFLVMRLTFVLVILIFFINALFHRNLLESFLFSAALAVGLTPELLPMIITLNLSRGSLAMAKHGVIVKRLNAIQDLGSMDILCTDKTGTLTEDNIILIKCVDVSGKEDFSIFKYAYITSHFRSGFNNPLDNAIKHYKEIQLEEYKKISEIPFDYSRKRDSIIVNHGQRKLLVTKGAPDLLLEISTTYGHKDGKTQIITPNLHEKLIDRYKQLSHEGYRVLGVASKVINDKQKTFEASDEDNLHFHGFIAFLDPPKQNVSETLQKLEDLGIEIKVITGDNELVTHRVAHEIKLKLKGTLVGSEIDALNDRELEHVAKSTTVFAKVSPEQKKRIINILQRSGHVVGYLGDGINDSPSLQTADVGISVNNAVNVAKESADIILLRKSLAALVEGVIEGRKTFSNTSKYLMMSLSSNFGNMFSMAGASIVLPFLPMLPTQILLNNLLYDASQFTLPEDAVDSEVLEKPHKMNIKFLRKFMIIFGPLSSLFDFLTFFVLFAAFRYSGSAFQSGWFIESLASQILVIYILRTKKTPFLKSRPGVSVLLATILALMVGLVIVQSPIGKPFHFVAMPSMALLSIVSITLLYLAAVEFVKRYFYKHTSKRLA